MASHMRSDDAPTAQRVSASGREAGRHAASVIDEGLHVEAQDVRSSRRYFYMPDEGKARRTRRASRSRRRHHGSGRRSHRGLLIALFVIIALAAAVGGAGYYFGRQLYGSARTVKREATDALALVSDLKGQITSGDYAGAQQSAAQMSSLATKMGEELDGDLWRLAERMPTYGADVSKVRTLASVFQDLADNALIPMTDELSGLSFEAIVGTEGKIDVDALVGLTTALGNVSDVINRNAEVVDGLGEAKLEQVNEPLQKVRTQMVELDSMAQGALKVTPVLAQMLGGGGNARHYLVVAVSPAEMRAGGGFAGSTGLLDVTDGKLDLGEFASFAGLQRDEDVLPDLTSEEKSVFGEYMRNRSDNNNITPQFPRAATLYSQLWTNVKGGPVDGVISIDPVFLQGVLALTGGVEVSNGWVVDGTNAAELLLNTVYLDYGNDGTQQDAIFTEVADIAFEQFTSKIGEVGLTNVLSLISDAASSRRLQVWMANPDEEAIMEELGISGSLATDPEAPVLGVYLNDHTWAKMGWYLDFRTSLDEGVRNPDGSMTYHATTTVTNTMTEYEASVAPMYITGSNPDRRNAGDMRTQVLLFAPAGGSIADVQASGSMDIRPRDTSLYGFQLEIMDFWTNLGETTTITYTVTTAPGAPAPMVVRMSPTCRSFE